MASDLTIYHNPRCSKSRATLKIMVDKGLDPEVVDYQKQGLSEATVQQLVDALKLPAARLVRRGESIYQDKMLNADEMSNDELISLIVQHPILLERPVVTNGTRAIIGRPPENVLALL